MAAVNLKIITQAVERILKNNLQGYRIFRNPEVVVDPNVARRRNNDGGWIGVYRGPCEYAPFTTGDSPFMAFPKINVEVWIASAASPEKAEDELEDSVKEIMDVLTDRDNLTLDDTVLMSNGYELEYDYDKDNQIYMHGCVITITTEVRA
jgi:hypothetical protein